MRALLVLCATGAGEHGAPMAGARPAAAFQVLGHPGARAARSGRAWMQANAVSVPGAAAEDVEENAPGASSPRRFADFTRETRGGKDLGPDGQEHRMVAALEDALLSAGVNVSQAVTTRLAAMQLRRDALPAGHQYEHKDQGRAFERELKEIAAEARVSAGDLAFAEQLVLIARVQRMKHLERVYAALEKKADEEKKAASQETKSTARPGRPKTPRQRAVQRAVRSALDRADTAVRESVHEATTLLAEKEQVNLGGPSVQDLARAGGVSVAELRAELREGVQARERLVEQNLGLVFRLIQKLSSSSGGRIDQGTTQADLAQEGCMELLAAAESFDLSKKVRFSTYATNLIRFRLINVLQTKTRLVAIPNRVVNYHRKIRKAREQLEMETGVRPSSAAISEELALWDLRLSPEKIEHIVKQVEHRPTSLDGRGRDGSTYETKDDLSKVGETAYSELDREADLVRGALREDLTQLMQRFLTADEARVLSLKFGLEDGEKRTMREVAEQAGITYIKVKNTYNNALNRLRAPLVLGRLQNYLADLDE